MSQKMPKIAFQGELGANSHIACRKYYPEHEPLPCATFELAFKALSSGEASLAMLPIENTVAGRVADIHRLLPGSGMYIIGEHFMRVRHCLLGVRGADIKQIKQVQSHVMALGQCRQLIQELGLEPLVAADTAGSARHVSELNDPSLAAIAPDLAAEIYGLDILRADIQDSEKNTTRFLIMSSEPDDASPEDGEGNFMTSFIFRVRNVPAALYKALGGFATNNVNMTKLESYQLDGSFAATQFYADIEGHPESPAVQRALEELTFYCSQMDVLGVYHAAPERSDLANQD
mgnify:CR=1 FL=1